MSALTPHIRVMRAVAAALLNAARKLEREESVLETKVTGKPSKGHPSKGTKR